MTATVDEIQIEGTPEEIHRFLNLRNQNYKEWQKALEEMMKHPPEPIPLTLSLLPLNVT